VKNVFSSFEKFPRKGGRKVSSMNIDYSSQKCEKRIKMDRSRGVARVEGRFFFSVKRFEYVNKYWRRSVIYMKLKM